MGRFTYVENPEKERDSFFDLIINSAYIKVLSARVNDQGDMESVVTLSDMNLPGGAITLRLIVNTQQRRVTSVEKTTTPVASKTLKEVKIEIHSVLGNDLDELCYGLALEEAMGLKKEFEIIVRPSGKIDYFDYGDDDLPTQVEKDAQE